MFFSQPIHINAQEITNSEDGKTIMIMIVQNGKTTFLEGEQAEDYLNEKKLETDKLKQAKLNLQNKNYFKSTDSLSEIMPIETVHYFNVYEEVGSSEDVHRYDLKENITEYWKNSTSTQQSHTFGWASSCKWTTNITLESAEKKALKAVVGSSWQKEYSNNGSVTINVVPGKTVWMTYYPIMDNSYGNMEYVKVDLLGNVTVLLSKWVDTYSPSLLYNPLLDADVPNGVYEWREK
ncbi:hypothetical protein SH1V18_18050 [Vallitalea longa]|uniref:Uncharacterized protein n=1 Tax=Vallitalea longa TaxID=2936439 RepID=A0A9W6DEB2_9FIRM|nr:hypothetical protein [Vallitalea longa]GKX29325.1 hypothetical protein SH1V18_18050 [Vallitalea longa]